MSDAPERIWLTGYVKDQYGARLGRGTISDLDHSPNPDYPEYVRADRIEQLVATCEELEAKLQHQTDLIEQLFALLDKTEQTDDGRSFHPNQLRSCRVSDTEKLNKILTRLKGTKDNALLF